MKNVHKTTHATSARTILKAIGIVVTSKICPNTPPVLIPWCMMIVAVVIPIPTIRPMERSVPARRIRAATPSARNILGEACCRIFNTLLYVRSGDPFIIGVMIHRMIKIKRIAIYKPFCRRNDLRLNVYL